MTCVSREIRLNDHTYFGPSTLLIYFKCSPGVSYCRIREYLRCSGRGSFGTYLRSLPLLVLLAVLHVCFLCYPDFVTVAVSGLQLLQDGSPKERVKEGSA